MWFEILPSAAIMFVGAALPHATMYVVHRLALGNSYRRDLTSLRQRGSYLRDWRLTGNPYKCNGLEVIPEH